VNILHLLKLVELPCNAAIPALARTDALLRACWASSIRAGNSISEVVIIKIKI